MMDSTFDFFAHDVVIRSAIVALGLQQTDGSMPAGHNGPHRHLETPVRNTGHWLITWCFAARLTGEERFRNAASMAADFLLRGELRPGGFTYHHRSAPDRDHCNGLMGPAFSIESLVEGGKFLERPELTQLACELIDMHPYNPAEHLWQIRETDGRLLGRDGTLNHQIWFASAISNLGITHRKRYEADLRRFCDNLEITMGLRRDGRVCHFARNAVFLKRLYQRHVESRLRLGKGSFEQQEYRERAYHLFNLFPLAVIRRNGVPSTFWRSKKLSQACQYARGRSYIDAVEDAGFVKPHIPAGFPLSFAERALVNEVFETPDKMMQSALLEQQFGRTFNPDSNFLDVGTVDPVTQAARIYEITRLHPIAINRSRAGLPESW